MYLRVVFKGIFEHAKYLNDFDVIDTDPFG